MTHQWTRQMVTWLEYWWSPGNRNAMICFHCLVKTCRRRPRWVPSIYRHVTGRLLELSKLLTDKRISWQVCVWADMLILPPPTFTRKHKNLLPLNWTLTYIYITCNTHPFIDKRNFKHIPTRSSLLCNKKCACNVTVIVIWNGHGNSSSNPRRSCLRFT